MSSISVIIPFFSREKSTLAETVRSALNQSGVPTPRVIVVDDGSPFPAATELQALSPAELSHIHILRQTNAGPPFARNAGLNAIPNETLWTAFLDSDDIWAPDHLTRALSALGQEYDFYFCNHERLVTGMSHFTHCQFDPAPHPLLRNGDTLHRFNGDFFSRNLVRSPVGTSTAVFRRATLGDLRFPTFPWTWEDLMFWLQVADRTDKIVFDSTVKVFYGPGGLAGADGWRSPAEMRRKLWYIQHFANVRTRFQLTPDQRAIVEHEVRQHSQGFSLAVLGLLAHRRLPPLGILWQFLRWHPQVAWIFCEVMADQVRQKLHRVFA